MGVSVSQAPTLALRTLLEGVIDYAGLFPPASLQMANAVREYREHRGSPDAWALGRFILPAARLDEFREAVGASGERWLLSALLGSDIEEDLGRIAKFNEESVAVAGGPKVDTIEVKATSIRDVERADELVKHRYDMYVEIPAMEDPDDLIAAANRAKARAKIRTGGTTADAFPTSADVTRFIARCLSHYTPFKATAGLHHPMRSEYRLTYALDAEIGTMHGFLNVLLTTAAMGEGMTETSAVELLDERNPGAFTFEENTVYWRGLAIPTRALYRARGVMLAFGSCSFREPITDLRSMRLL